MGVYCLIKKAKVDLIKEAGMAKNNKDVDLYNPKFMHFEWDGSLMGKVGFYGDDIGTIKEELRHKGPHRTGTVLHYSDSEACPFTVKSRNSGCVGGWRFFYYDPNYKVKWAYFKKGKPIQLRRCSAYEWTDLCPWSDTVTVKGPEDFDDDYEYRIKPEEPTDIIKVDVKILARPSVDTINVVVNGKACTFDNVEDARQVLGLDIKEPEDE